MAREWQAGKGVAMSVVTTVLSAAATYDLVNLAVAKDELGLGQDSSSDDGWIGRAISQISKAVMNDCNRVFAPETVQDVFDCSRSGLRVTRPIALQLSRWPVLAVTSVVQITGSVGTTQTLVEGTDFRTDDTDGQLVRLDAATGRVRGWEPLSTTVIYSAGYGSTVTETHTVPGTPYAQSVTNAATFSCDRQVSYASGTALARVSASPAHGQYTVTSAGLYTFNAADTGQVLTFAYCTANTPDDIEDAALRLITGRYKAKDRDPNLIQKETPGIGTQRFWFGNAPGQTGPFTPDIEALLDNYRVPVAA